VNGVFNIFLRDLRTKTTSLVSINADGTAGGNGAAGTGRVTPDGRFVAFDSFASDLVPGGTSGVGNVFVRALRKGTTTVVSVNRTGTAGGNDLSAGPFISDGGRFVTFKSDASDLVDGDSNFESDTFVRDLRRRTTTVITVDQSGSPVGGDYEPYVMSANGRMGAFESDSAILVDNDTNPFCDGF